MSVWDEIKVYPYGCVNIMDEGGPIYLRLCLRHDASECGWSVAFESTPTNQVSFPRVMAEVEDHILRCPYVRDTEGMRKW